MKIYSLVIRTGTDNNSSLGAINHAFREQPTKIEFFTHESARDARYNEIQEAVQLIGLVPHLVELRKDEHETKD